MLTENRALNKLLNTLKLSWESNPHPWCFVPMLLSLNRASSSPKRISPCFSLFCAAKWGSHTRIGVQYGFDICARKEKSSWRNFHHILILWNSLSQHSIWQNITLKGTIQRNSAIYGCPVTPTRTTFWKWWWNFRRMWMNDRAVNYERQQVEMWCCW